MVGLLGVIYFIAFADRLALSLLVEPIKRDLKISDSQIGLLFGFSFAAALAVTSLPLARLADRSNRRNLISACVAVWSLMTAVSGLAGSFAGLLACRVGLAVGEAGLTPAALSLIADTVGPRRRTLALSAYLTAGVAGATGSLIVVAAVVQWASGHTIQLPGLGELAPWRLTLMSIGASSIGLAGLVRLAVREPSRTAGGASSAVWPALDYLRSRASSYLGYFVAGAIFALLSISASAWYPTLLIRERGLTAGQVGYLFGAVSLVGGTSGSLVVPLQPTPSSAGGRTRLGWSCWPP